MESDNDFNVNAWKRDNKLNVQLDNKDTMQDYSIYNSQSIGITEQNRFLHISNKLNDIMDVLNKFGLIG